MIRAVEHAPGRLYTWRNAHGTGTMLIVACDAVADTATVYATTTYDNSQKSLMLELTYAIMRGVVDDGVWTPI